MSPSIVKKTLISLAFIGALSACEDDKTYVTNVIEEVVEPEPDITPETPVFKEFKIGLLPDTQGL
jgi:hypothetical protein